MSTPKVSTEEVIERLNLSAQEWDYEKGDTTTEGLRSRVQNAIMGAFWKTRRAVGVANYDSTGTNTSGEIKQAEFDLASAAMLRQRKIALASRPEEAPPPEYINVDALEPEIERLERDWAEGVAAYRTDESSAKGAGWSHGYSGVDETEKDIGTGDYEDIDFGELPSS